jgi:hypothetical protein
MHCLETIAIRNAEHSGRRAGIVAGSPRAEAIVSTFAADAVRGAEDAQAAFAFVAAYNLLATAPGREAR